LIFYKHNQQNMQAELCATEICRPTFAPAKYGGRPLRQRKMQADLRASEICRPSFAPPKYAGQLFPPAKYAGRLLRHRNMQNAVNIINIFKFSRFLCSVAFVTVKTTIKSHSTYFQKQLPKYAGGSLRHRNKQADLCASEKCRPTFAPPKNAGRPLRHRNCSPTFAPPKYAGQALRQRNMQAKLCASEICWPTFPPAKYAGRLFRQRNMQNAVNINYILNISRFLCSVATALST
jgi:hypothetical protein